MKKDNNKKEEAPVNEEVNTVEENAADADETRDVDESLEASAEVLEGSAEVLEGEGDIPEIEVSDSEGEAVDPIEAELATLRLECDRLKDQALRARAEFDNYRKRMARENDRIRKTAAEGLIRDLLPTLDHLELALSHVEDKNDDLAQGVEMIVKQFIDVLSAQGLDPIPAKGELFDPNVHEALTHQPSEEYPADTVMEEFKRGYRLGDFTLRPSQVVVSSGPVEAVENQEEETEASASETSE